MITLQELRSIVATAHENDLLVRAHVMKSTMLDIALETGVDVIEHVPLPSYFPEDLEAYFDDVGVFRIPSSIEEQMHRMIDQGVVLVPTLDAYRGRDNDPETEIFFQAALEIVRFFQDSGGIIAVGNDYQ